MSKRLYVGNLSYSTTESELREVFERLGSVTDVKVMMDRETGRPRGFAFVEMSTDEEARDAISQLNGTEVGGRTLKINEALRSQEQFSDNDEGPSIPDQVERVRSRATVVVGAVGPSRCHILNLLLD